MKTWSYIGIAIFAIICFATFLVAGAPDNPSQDEPITPEPTHTLDYETELPGQNFFIIEYPDDVHEPYFWTVRFQVPPPEWPGAMRATIYTDLLLRGVSVATSISDHTRHFRQTDRQRKARSAATSFIWHVLSRTEYLWAENPQPNHDRSAAIVDVYYKRGSVTVNLAEALVEMGHASYTDKDWGKP